MIQKVNSWPTDGINGQLGVYFMGCLGLGHPTANIDRRAKK
jgi:hypothetical protein